MHARQAQRIAPRQALIEKEIVSEVKSELSLIVRHAANGTRNLIAQHLEGHRSVIEMSLLSELEVEFSNWSKSLNHLLEAFEAWLHRTLSREMSEISGQERTQILAPLEKVKRQVFRALQNFRDRLSERTMRAYGVPLRTTEAEIFANEPRSPDVRVGRVFDRNWELLSPVAPVWLVKPLVKRHFAGKVPYMVEKNLSRLASQWAESGNAAIEQAGSEAERRLDDLIRTVERLVTTGGGTAPQIRTDLERIRQIAPATDKL